MKIYEMSEGKFVASIAAIIAGLMCLIIPACNNTPTSEQSYSRAVTGATTIRSVQSNGDTLIITYTPSSYTASKLDTVVRRQGSTPVDTTQVPPTTDYGTLIYSTGYDGIKDLDPFGNNQYGNGSISATVYRTGPGSFHSVPANVSAGIRSEVQYPESLTPIEGTIVWDVMYETVFQNSGHSIQFHPNTKGGSASPGLWHENGKLVWVNWKGGTNTKYPTSITIQAAHWYHMVFSYKFGSNGYMHFWVDNQLVLDRNAIQVNDGSGAYLKVGVNMWQDQKSVVYYDNVSIYKK